MPTWAARSPLGCSSASDACAASDSGKVFATYSSSDRPSNRAGGIAIEISLSHHEQGNDVGPRRRDVNRDASAHAVTD